MSVADIADKIICMLPQSQKDLLKKIHEALRNTGKQFHLHNHYSLSTFTELLYRT